MRYSIVYADPPWTYRDKAVAGRRGAGFKYPTLNLAALERLPVAELAAPDSALFLWATWPLLPDAIGVMKAWGFRYRTIGFVWVKTTRTGAKLFWGMGNWTRSNTEICLLGMRGKPRRVSAGVHSVVQAPIRAHSQKPGEVRERIVELMGDLPRIELFARERTPGWDAWGDEVESDIDLVPTPSAEPVQQESEDRTSQHASHRWREPAKARPWSTDEITARLLSRLRRAPDGLTVSELLAGMPGVPRARIRRILASLASEGRVEELGAPRARRWHFIPGPPASAPGPTNK